MAASYPTTIKTFPTRANNDVITPAMFNDPDDEITAVETALLQGFDHNLNAPGFRYDDAASKTIASGVITITSGYLEVDTEGAAASDDLDTITIGVMTNGIAIGEGSIIVLQSTSAARVITVKHGTGNISLIGGDYVMNSLLSRLTLMYSGAAWVEIARGVEMGTWTPVIGGSGGTSGQTYTRQIGRWIKNGKQVTAFCEVLLAAKGTITTSVQIQGLPFALENTANQFVAATIPYFNTLAVAYATLGGYGTANTTAVTLQGVTAAAVVAGTSTSSTVLATADIANTTGLMMSITYVSKT